jgi:hypothetical protein
MPPPEMVDNDVLQGSTSPPKDADEEICVYCYRAECAGCPLRFDDKVTLRQVLEGAGVPTQSNYLYECVDQTEQLRGQAANETAAENDKKKKNNKSQKKAVSKSKKSKKETGKAEK